MEKLYFIDVEAKMIKAPDQRFYSTPSGVFPSATTILSAKAKDGLTNWQINLAKQGLDPKEMSRQAMAKGSKVHNACEAWMKGETLEFYNPETLEENYDLYNEWVPILRFIDFFKTHEVEPILIEQTIYSPTHGYAGTLDLLCRLKPDKKKPGKVLMLIDLKTSAAAYVEYHWQVAAYRYAFWETFSADPAFEEYVTSKVTLGEPLVPAILLLNVDTQKGWRLTVVEDLEEKMQNFLACKTLWAATHKNYEYWKALYPTTLRKGDDTDGTITGSENI